MMQIHPTLEAIEKMQEDRLRQAKEQLAKAETEGQRKRIEARIWRIENS